MPVLMPVFERKIIHLIERGIAEKRINAKAASNKKGFACKRKKAVWVRSMLRIIIANNKKPSTASAFFIN